MTSKNQNETAHDKWSLCVFLCVFIASIAGCTAYVDGKKAEAVCERISR